MENERTLADLFSASSNSTLGSKTSQLQPQFSVEDRLLKVEEDLVQLRKGLHILEMQLFQMADAKSWPGRIKQLTTDRSLLGLSLSGGGCYAATAGCLLQEIYNGDSKC
jgi:hypothetical protein